MVEFITVGDTNIMIMEEYFDKGFEFFEKKEDLKAVYIKSLGLLVGKNSESYREDIILEIKKKFPDYPILSLFTLNNKPFLVSNGISPEEAKKYMKNLKVEYMLDLDTYSLYFSGLLFDNRFVNSLRKKLGLEVLRLNEV